MRIRSVRIYRLSIPFCLPISHNLADRREGEAVVAVLEDEEGRQGFGEGTPREYVTGENIFSCLRAVQELAVLLGGLEAGSSEALLGWAQDLGSRRLAETNPSAWCALELALLDLWGRRTGVPVWKLFAEEPKIRHLAYSAVLPLLPDPVCTKMAELIKQARIRHVKIKVNGLAPGIARLRLVREILGPEVDIRVDANGAFSAGEACAFLSAAANLGISAFEQPVPKNELAWLSEVARNPQRVPVIADESLCTPEDARTINEAGACQGLNIRLSKCGGLLKSLRLWQVASTGGLFCQIGCHVGESAILSAAGRHLATLCPDHVYLEGSLSKYLLQEDLATTDLTFGPGGLASILEGPGLGIEIDLARLSRWGELVGIFP